MSGLFGENANANRGESEGSGTKVYPRVVLIKELNLVKECIGFSLEGRGVGGGGLVKPNYTVDESGTL